MQNKGLLIGVNILLVVGFVYFLNWNTAPKVPVIVKEVVPSKPISPVEPKILPESEKFTKVEELPTELPLKESKPLENEALVPQLEKLQAPLLKKLEYEQFLQSDEFKKYLYAQQVKIEEFHQKSLINSLETQIAQMKKAQKEKEMDEAMMEGMNRWIVLPVTPVVPAAPTVPVSTKDQEEDKNQPSVGEKLSSLVTLVQDLFKEKHKAQDLIEPKITEDYNKAHQELLKKATTEKIPEQMIQVFEKLSKNLNGLKSKQIKEIEVIRKEDSFVNVYDFLFNTGDRYIVLSVSVPKEPTPYSATGSSYGVDFKVTDTNEEVLNFHVNLEEKTQKWEQIEIAAYVPGDWVKLLKSLK